MNVGTRLLTSLGAVLVVTGGLSTVYFALVFVDAQLTSLEVRALSVSRLLADQIAVALHNGEKLGVRAAQRAGDRDDDFRFAVAFDASGELQMAHGVPFVVDVEPGFIRASSEEGSPVWDIRAGADERVARGNGLVQVTVPVVYDGGAAVLVTGFSTTSIEAQRDRIIASMFAVSGLGLLLTMLAIFAVVRRSITEPARQLLLGTTALSAGHLGHRIAHEGSDELGRLAAHFNGMASALEKADASQRDFFASVTHELRAPSHSIVGFCDIVLQVEQGLSERGRANIDRVRTSARRLTRLVDDLLDLAKADARQIQLDIQPVDVGALLEECAEAGRAMAGAQPVTLSASADGVDGFCCDEQRVRQILTNLVSNAVRFTERGTIELQARREAGDVVVDVKDTGPGIAAAELAGLFQPFHQIHGGRSRGGSGLGLAIVKTMTETLGGTVRATSEVGVGSCFSVRLPFEAPCARS